MKGTIRDKKRLDEAGEWVVEKEYLIDGQVVSEAEFEVAFPEQVGTPMFGSSSSAWPLRSDALAVHTKQIPAVIARNAKHGLHIPYDRAGRPILADQGQRKALMKIEGVKQQNSYYGA